MRIAVLGRTQMLFDAAKRVQSAGHDITIVGTAPASPESTAGVDEFRLFAESSRCPFFCASKLQDKHIDLLAGSISDVAITMNWPTLIPDAAVACFRLGIINAHGSDLPKFRGNACPNWAIIAGEERIGLTFHFVDPGALDTGDIVHKTWITNSPDLYIGDVYRWLETAVPQ